MAKFYFFYSSFMDYAIKTRKKGYALLDPHTGSVIPPNLSPSRFYEIMLPEMSKHWSDEASTVGPRHLEVERAAKTWLQASIESKWYALGRPEYKVHPGMVEALAHTTLDLPVSAFNLPYPVFVIRLPSKHLLEYRDAPFVRALLVTRVREVHYGIERNKLVISANFSEMAPGLDPLENNIITKVDMGAVDDEEESKSVEWYLDQMPKANTSDGLYWPSDAMTREIVALSAAVSLIGIGADRNIVTPARESTTDRMTRQKIEKRHGRGSAGTDYGFEVGRDIRLPRLPRKYDKPEEKGSSGRHLAYGHVRSGHMKMQPCGPGRTQRKLIFVAPTVVRPDLPLKPKSTPHSVEPGAA